MLNYNLVEVKTIENCIEMNDDVASLPADSLICIHPRLKNIDEKKICLNKLSLDHIDRILIFVDNLQTVYSIEEACFCFLGHKFKKFIMSSNVISFYGQLTNRVLGLLNINKLMDFCCYFAARPLNKDASATMDVLKDDIYKCVLASNANAHVQEVSDEDFTVLCCMYHRVIEITQVRIFNDSLHKTQLMNAESAVNDTGTYVSITDLENLREHHLNQIKDKTTRILSILEEHEEQYSLHEVIEKLKARSCKRVSNDVVIQILSGFGFERNAGEVYKRFLIRCVQNEENFIVARIARLLIQYRKLDKMIYAYINPLLQRLEECEVIIEGDKRYGKMYGYFPMSFTSINIHYRHLLAEVSGLK